MTLNKPDTAGKKLWSAVFGKKWYEIQVHESFTT